MAYNYDLVRNGIGSIELHTDDIVLYYMDYVEGVMVGYYSSLSNVGCNC